MPETYDKLKALLDNNKALTQEDIEKMVKESGEMTSEEKVKLEADRLEAAKSSGDKITMDQYLEACKTLDTAQESSDEYKKADALVKKYEKGQ